MPTNRQLKGKYVECEWCGKIIYKTPSQLKKHEHHYCSNKCQSEKKHAETYEDRVCEICGGIMHVSKKSTQRFCSTECQKIWQTQQTGELNVKFTQVKVHCEHCNAEFFVKKYKTESGQTLFCSKECRQSWYSTVWSQSDEWKEKSRIRAVEMLQCNKIDTLTKPQIVVNELLDFNKIKYNNEEPFVYYSVDNYLTDCNLVIEVLGDYWHGNPIRFTKLNDLQIKNIKRDKAKRTFIKKYYNINILYLWENDILNKPELCSLLIELYISNNGVLENYHSFNYILQDNHPVLGSSLIQPYQDMDGNKIKEYIKITT